MRTNVSQLRERYVRGDIEADEFERRLDALLREDPLALDRTSHPPSLSAVNEVMRAAYGLERAGDSYGVAQCMDAANRAARFRALTPEAACAAHSAAGTRRARHSQHLASEGSPAGRPRRA